MAEGDRAAVDVDPRGVEAERADGREHDDGEGLVHLEQVDVGRDELRRREHLPDGVDGRHGKVLGRPAGNGGGDDACTRRESVATNRFLARDDERRGAVGDRRGVGGGDRAAGLEGGPQPGQAVEVDP